MNKENIICTKRRPCLRGISFFKNKNCILNGTFHRASNCTDTTSDQFARLSSATSSFLPSQVNIHTPVLWLSAFVPLYSDTAHVQLFILWINKLQNTHMPAQPSSVLCFCRLMVQNTVSCSI